MTTKKLPRRVQSMAKRAVKTAEEASDLDLLGGDEEANKPPASVGAQVGAFTLIIVALIAIIMIVKLVAAIPTGSNGDATFGVQGALPHATPTTEPQEGSQRSTLPSVPRSPFPSAQQDTPIILKVTCPAGTIQIATGDMVADTVCIRGVLVDNAAPPDTAAASTEVPNVILITAEGDRANVGGTDVPNGLTCEEDEVIGFAGVPDTLVCLHVDSFLP